MNLFGFRGTVSRTQFWLVTLAGSLAAFILALPLSWLPVGVLLDSYLAFLCGFYWVLFALHAKRLRDAGLNTGELSNHPYSRIQANTQNGP